MPTEVTTCVLFHLQVVKEPDNEPEACRPSGSTAHDAQRDFEQKAAGRPQHAADLCQDAAVAAAGQATDGAATPAAPKRRKMLVLPRFVLPSAAHATKTAAGPQPASAASQQAPAPQEQPSAATCKEPAAERPAAAMTPAPAAATAIRGTAGAPATPGKGKQALAGTSTGKKPAAAAAKPANKTPADATRPAAFAGREPTQQCAAAAPAATSAQAEAANADGMPVQKPPGGRKRKLLATAADTKPDEAEPDAKPSTSAAAVPRPSPAAPEPATAAPAGASEPEAANDAEAAGAGARSAAVAGQASQQRSKQRSTQPLQQKPPAPAASAAPAPKPLPTRSAVPAKQRAPASKQPPAKGSADDGRTDNGTPPAKRPQQLPAVLTSTLPALGELSKGATGSLSARSVIGKVLHVLFREIHAFALCLGRAHCHVKSCHRLVIFLHVSDDQRSTSGYPICPSSF